MSTDCNLRFYETKYIGSVIEHAAEQIANLKILSQQAPRYKEAVIRALQHIQKNLNQGTLETINFRGLELDGSTKGHVKQLVSTYLGTSTDAPLPTQLLDGNGENPELIPSEDISTMKTLLLEQANSHVKGALEALSRKRAADVCEETPTAIRAKHRESLAEKRSAQQRLRAQAENVRLRQVEAQKDLINISEVFTTDEAQTAAQALQEVRIAGRHLGRLRAEFRANKEVVLEAFRQDPWSVYYASPALKADPEFLIDCLKIYPEHLPGLLIIADVSLRSNLTFLINCLKFSTPENAHRVYAFADYASPEFVLECLKAYTNTGSWDEEHWHEFYDFVPVSLRSDPDFLLKCIQIASKTVPCVNTILEFAGFELRGNRAFMFEVCRLCESLDPILRYAPTFQLRWEARMMQLARELSCAIS